MNPILSLVLGAAIAVGLPDVTLADKSCPPTSWADPLPGASSVTFHENSVTTARFPGQWQEGQFGAGKLDYRLFVDGSGTVSNDLRLRGWRVDFTCDPKTRKCSFRSASSPPEAAVKTAKAIGACLTAVPPKPMALRDNPTPAPARKSKATPSRPTTKTTPAAKPADPTKAATPAPIAKTEGKSVAAPEPASGGATVTGGAIAAPEPLKAAPAPAVQVPVSSVLAIPAARLLAEGALPLANCVQLSPSSEHATRSTASPDQAAGARAQTLFECDIPRTPALKTGARNTSVVLAQTACWADHLPDEPANARIQRMLLLAGFDAGPVDGKPGERTKTALVAALGGAAVGPEDNIIRQLRAILCK